MDPSVFKKSKDAASSPDPVIFSPTGAHTQTFIILHGRGSNGATFGTQFLAVGKCLRTTFPSAKFIFPTAPKSRAASFNRSVLNQWFDNYSPLTVDSQCQNEERQLQGLKETSVFLHEILRREIDVVGAKNVIIGGLSQGCAASLIAGLTWDGPALGGIFGLCGWLPLRSRIEECIARPLSTAESRVEEDVDFFERDEDANSAEGGVLLDLPTQAMHFLREELDLPSSNAVSSPTLCLHTPVFLAHGSEDEKIPVELGREAVNCLKILGAKVEAREYDELGHWYSIDMLADLANFLTDVCGFNNPKT
ncbi:hypothetical protein MMC09_000912 [Bachmanniomyces sp. S44760]|nr:hypothetical protein [Bachmanniomyces sp. S44760]